MLRFEAIRRDEENGNTFFAVIRDDRAAEAAKQLVDGVVVCLAGCRHRAHERRRPAGSVPPGGNRDAGAGVEREHLS